MGDLLSVAGAAGGGGPWLQVDPVVHGASFTPAIGFVHLLGFTSKFATITLPVSTSTQDVIAFKATYDTLNWSFTGGVIDNDSDPGGFWNPAPQWGYQIIISAGDGVNWYHLSSNRFLDIVNSGNPFAPAISKIGRIDFYGPHLIVGSGAGNASVSVDFAKFGQPSSHLQLTYKPGSTNQGPFVFNNFSLLMTAIADSRYGSLATTFDILFDDSMVSPIVIPAGTYDMEGVTWKGYHGKTAPGPLYAVDVSVSEGVVFSDFFSTGVGRLRSISDDIYVTFTGTTPPNLYVNVPDAGLVFNIGRNASLKCTAGPFIKIQNTSSGFSQLVIDGGFISNSGYEAIELAGPGSTALIIFADAHPRQAGSSNEVIGSSTIRGTGGSVTVNSSPHVLVSALQPNLVSPPTILVSPSNTPFYSQNVSGGTVTALLGVNVFNVSSPTNVLIGNAYNKRGRIITVKSNSLSTSNLTLTTSGGSTIDGASTLVISLPNKSVTVVSDGISSWHVISST
jgi:hypothetical protein